MPVRPIPDSKGTAFPGDALQTGEEWINLHSALGEQKKTFPNSVSLCKKKKIILFCLVFLNKTFLCLTFWRNFPCFL